MSRRTLVDPYRAAIQQFNRLGVRYVVVGMAGINYYGTSPAETFVTMDYDVFVDPTRANIERALRSLQRLGFALGTTAGPFRLDQLPVILRARTALIASSPEGFLVELLLAVSGYTFSEMAEDAVTITVRGVPVRVGTLRKLLRSKRLAGRLKDRQFLRRYASLLEQTASRRTATRRRPPSSHRP